MAAHGFLPSISGNAKTIRYWFKKLSYFAKACATSDKNTLRDYCLGRIAGTYALHLAIAGGRQ